MFIFSSLPLSLSLALGVDPPSVFLSHRLPSHSCIVGKKKNPIKCLHVVGPVLHRVEGRERERERERERLRREVRETEKPGRREISTNMVQREG